MSADQTPEPTGVTIRRYRRGDSDAIAAITAEVFGPFSVEGHIERVLGAPGQPSWLEIKLDDIRRELQVFADACFVAEAGGRVVGYITNTIKTSASRGTISNLAVAAACQGRGIGRRLLLRSLEHFRSLGLKQAKIETLATNEVGKRLYPSVGFRRVVAQIHYIMPLD